MNLETLAVGIFGGVVTIFGNSVLERLKSQHSLSNEQYKIQLKKSEFFFQEQFKAAVRFGKYFNSILPENEHYMMDWDDAVRFIANNFKKHQVFLDEFISDVDILFTHETIMLLHKCTNEIANYNDDFNLHQMNDFSPQDWENQKWKYGNKFYLALEEAHKAIKQTISEQVKY